MGEFNPYAPSKAVMTGRATPSSVDTEIRVWRDGKVVVALHDASLPARCVKCNHPAHQPTKMRTIYWVNPFLYLLLLISPLILIIVYVIVRKKADVNPGLCERHKKRRTYGLAAAWVSCLLGLASLFAGMAQDGSGLILVGILLLLVSIIAGMGFSRLIYPKKITKDEVRLRGFCDEYLDQLPDYR